MKTVKCEICDADIQGEDFEAWFKAAFAHWTVEHADIMKQMSQIMKEMSIPHGEQVQEKHQKELREMESEINPLFNHLVQPG